MPSPASIAAPSAILRSALHRLVASAALLPPRAMGAQARVSAACAAPRFSRESFCSLRSFATSASLSGSGSPSSGGTIADRKRFIAPFPPAASGAHPSSASKRRRGGPEGPSADSARDERSGGVTGRCIAYCSADSYDLDALQALLLQRHRVSKRYGHDVLHVEIPASVPSFEADAFVFRDGSVVFWNARDSDIAELRGDLKPLESNPPPVTEFEEMTFKLGPSARVKSGVLLLTADADPREIAREKMAFSYGLQRSVRLAVIEEAVDSAIGGMRDIPVALLTHGRLKMKKADVMRSLGKLLALRGTAELLSIFPPNCGFRSSTTFPPKSLIRRLQVPSTCTLTCWKPRTFTGSILGWRSCITWSAVKWTSCPGWRARTGVFFAPCAPRITCQQSLCFDTMRCLCCRKLDYGKELIETLR
jgi:hypothetical protein